MGWPNEKWSPERRLSDDLKVGEIVGGSNFQQQITIDYIFILQCQLLHQSFYPPFISSVWSKNIIIHLQTTSPLSSEGSKPSVDKMVQGFSLQDRPEKYEVPLTRFMVAALLRYASANSDASSHMASKTTGYNLPFFFRTKARPPFSRGSFTIIECSLWGEMPAYPLYSSISSTVRISTPQSVAWEVSAWAAAEPAWQVF